MERWGFRGLMVGGKGGRKRGGGEIGATRKKEQTHASANPNQGSQRPLKHIKFRSARAPPFLPTHTLLSR